MKTGFAVSAALLLPLLSTACGQAKGPDALSRIFRHNNGQRTETQKMGGEAKIRERVFDRNNILTAERIFHLDQHGRILSGVIYDGKKNPLGSTVNTFDPQTGQMLTETLKNNQGKTVRQLFYPGALKDPRFAKRMVAFNYNVDDQKAAPKEVIGNVKPIVPVTKDEDDFEPGLPQGTSAPTAQQAAAQRNSGSSAATGAAKPLPPRRSMFPQKKPARN